MTYFNNLGQARVGWRIPSGGVTPSYLLDTYTGATAAYSLRKLRSAYTGAAIRVRRSSDSTTLDVGFNADGTLDTTALLDFVGYRNNFNNSNVISTANAYVGNGVTLTPNWLTGPDGVTPSNKMNETTANSQHFVSYSIISGTIDSHNVSAYLKKGTGSAAPDRICIAVGNSTYRMYAIFNLSTGIIETQVAGTATSFEVKMTAEGNGFYRCSVGGKLNYSTNQVIRTAIQFCNNSSSYNPFTTSYIGNVNADVQMSYLQWLQGETVLQRYGTSATAGNGFVSIWYDQSGNGSNLIQNASANQARIVFGGILDTLNNKPALASNTNSAPNARYSATLTSISTSPFTLFHVGSNNGTASGYLFDGANGTNRINGRSFNTTSIQVGKNNSVIQLNYTQNITTQRIINAVLNNTSSKLSINNGSYTTGTTGALQGLSGLILGAAYDFTQGATAYYQEHIIYPSDQSSNVTNIDNDINSHYSIY